jgi:CubicO group peptidase (beta-lactamase class C family)
MKYFQALFTCFLFSGTGLVFAQSSVIYPLDSLANLFATEKCFNGEILVSVNNKAVYRKSIGYRDNVLKESIKPNAIFNLGSISKPFTSVAVLQLYKKGLLNINDPVIKYIPQFPYDSICIKHLLSHTSGMKQNLNQIEELDLKTNINNDSLITILSRYKPALFAQPGTEWIYSNIGYEILALIVERVSTMTFPEYMNKSVFEPANMKRTFIPANRNISGNLPKGITEQDLVVPHEFKNLMACEPEHVDSVNFVQMRKDFLYGSENIAP